MPPLRALVKAKQRKFFKKMWLERNDLDNDPLMHAMRVVLGYNYSISRYLNDMTSNYTNDVEEAQLTL